MVKWLDRVGGVQGRRASATRRRLVDGLVQTGVGALEHLEPRLVLSNTIGPAQFNPADRFREAVVTWHGIQVEAIQGSWVLTFRQELGKAAATERAGEIAQALGVRPSMVEATATGYFARIHTNDRVSEAAVQRAVAQFPFLKQIEPDTVARVKRAPNDPGYGQQWALNNTGQIENGQPGVAGGDLDAERAWNVTTGTSRVVLAVLDTGTDLAHPDLRANLWVNPGEIPNNGIDDDGNGFVDDINGWDFAADNGGQIGQDADPSDPQTQGHGTAVAGTIGAVGNNGIGVSGIMWDVSLITLKIFPNEGGSPLFSQLNAFDYLVVLKRDRGIDVVASNNSYGALRPDEFDQFDTAAEEGIQRMTDLGILFVAAAGNDTTDNDSSISAFPASYENPLIISVAATTNRDVLAGFSNFGATSVDVGAPGEQVLVTANGGGYERIDGTSFASPYTCGVIGLLSASNRFASAVQLRNALYAGVDVVPGLIGNVATNGRVNAFNSLRLVSVPGPIVEAILPGPISAPVDEITVAFSETIDPATFNPAAGITLRRTNGDGRFDGNDVFITFDSGSATLDGETLTLDVPGGELPRDTYRLVLDDASFRDLDGNFLNGTTLGGGDETYEFTIVAFRGPLEPNDSISQATPVILNSAGVGVVSEVFIGDGLFEAVDVDIFRIFTGGPALITATINARSLPEGSTLDSYLRLFDTTGEELANNDNFNGLDSKLQFFVSTGGIFYLGVSAYPNRTYLPGNPGSGVQGETGGLYELEVVVENATEDHQSFTRTPSPAQPIPSQGTITSTITVTDGRSVADLDVRLAINHTFVGDLRITLTGPGGGVTTLVNRRGGSGDNFVGTIFDDDAVPQIQFASAPFTGRFRPEGDLSQYYEVSGAGTWTLTITDNKALDAGTLVSWGLDFTLVNDVAGPFELNDTLLTATATAIDRSGARTFEAFIGDGAYGLRDVDLFAVFVDAGSTIQAAATPSGTLDTIIRIFKSDGGAVAIDRRKGATSSAVEYVAVQGGVYYIGVSGGNTTQPGIFGNDSYNPNVGGSGTETDSTGNYLLRISVSPGISEGELILRGDRLTVGLNRDGTLGVRTPENPGGVSLDGADFLLGGGVPEAFFGLSLDGRVIRNAGPTSQGDLATTVANESDFANRRGTTTGIVDGITIKRSLSFGVGDSFIAIDVSITNRGVLPVNDLAWVEGFNPQSFNQGGNANTFNDVPAFGAGRLGWAIAPNGRTIALAAPITAANVFTSFEAPNTVRDPFQVILTPVDPNGALGDLALAMAFNLGTLDPAETTRFRYFIMTGDSSAQVQAMYADLNSGGSGHLVPDPRAGSIAFADLPHALYYPEGFANSRASTFVPIVNPSDEGVRYVVIARYENTALAPDVLFDSATDTTGGVIDARDRGGLTLTRPDLYAGGTAERVQSEIAGRPGVRKDTPYALEIRSTLPLGATLSHYDFRISTGEAFTSALSPDWTFGDGAKGRGIFDFLVFYNPNSIPVKVTMTILPGSGGGPVLNYTKNVQPERRGGWSLGELPEIRDGTFGIRLDAESPIVASITHYDTRARKGSAALGLPTVGSTSGSTGEGQFGLLSSREQLSVVNPNSGRATMTFTFTRPDGSTFKRNLQVNGNSRATLELGSLSAFPSGTPFAVSYTSNLPVAVNQTTDTLTEQAGSVLAGQASTAWIFSEGFRPLTGRSIIDELRLFNPAAEDVTVSITLAFNNSESETFLRTVKSRTLGVFNLHDFVTGTRRSAGTVPGVGSFFGTYVQAATPITAYALHYDRFLGGGFGTVGTALGSTGNPA